MSHVQEQEQLSSRSSNSTLINKHELELLEDNNEVRALPKLFTEI